MKVSVALCTYNGERFLREQLDSILRQTRRVDEIVVCDDGSRDSTVEILRDYSRRHLILRLVVNEKNLGFVRNFEQALRLTTGDWVFLCDQDDLWHPEKVAMYLRAMEQHRNLGVVFGNATLIDEAGLSLEGTLQEAVIRSKLPAGVKVLLPRFAHRSLFSGNFVTGATMALNRSCLAPMFPFPREVIHDYWICLCAVFQGYSLRYVESALTSYRIHAGQSAGIGLHAPQEPHRGVELSPDRNVYALDKALVQRFSGQPACARLLVPHVQRMKGHRARRKRFWILRQPSAKRFVLVGQMLLAGEYGALHQGWGRVFRGLASGLRDLVRFV